MSSWQVRFEKAKGTHPEKRPRRATTARSKSGKPITRRATAATQHVRTEQETLPGMAQQVQQTRRRRSRPKAVLDPSYKPSLRRCLANAGGMSLTDVVCEVGDIYYHGAPVQYRRGAQALAWAAYTDRLSGQAISALVRRWRENPAIIGYDIARFAEIGEDNMSDVAQVCNRYGELVRYATMPQET